jgi:hypothetical protein
MAFPLQYRAKGAAAWLDGVVENIGRSGVLFKAPSLLPLDTAIELCFQLPVSLGRETGATILCDARVARQVPAIDPRTEAALAAEITHYRFASTPVREQ